MEALYQYIIFDLDGTLIKSEEGLYDSITYALEKSGVDPGDRKDMKRMVGDRMFDIEGAGEAGIRSIGVLYGYGDRQELINAGATYLAETPADVVKLVCRESV